MKFKKKLMKKTETDFGQNNSMVKKFDKTYLIGQNKAPSPNSQTWA